MSIRTRSTWQIWISSHQATLNSLARNKIAKIPIRQSQPKRAPLKRTTYSRRSLLKTRQKTCECHKWALSKNNSRHPCSRRLASSTSRTVTTVIHRLHRGMQTKTWRPAAALKRPKSRSMEQFKKFKETQWVTLETNNKTKCPTSTTCIWISSRRRWCAIKTMGRTCWCSSNPQVTITVSRIIAFRRKCRSTKTL